MIEWAYGELARRGKRVTGEPEVVHDRPWAKVARIPTDDGATFAKTMMPALGHEVAVTALLAQAAPDLVTPLIAHENERRFMLMEDAGERLRARIERDKHLRHWRGVLGRYADVQLKAAPIADALVAAGCPDMRVSALPAAFEAVIDGDRLLTIAGRESSTPEQLATLRALVPRVREWSERLVDTVPETIQHDDLHDGQVFFRDGQSRVLDWGDANVSHPFYSLVVLERHIVHQFELRPDAPELLRLREEYLEPFTRVATRSRIDGSLRLALLLGRLVRALTWTRQVSALPPDQREADVIEGWFALFIEAVSSLYGVR